MKEELGRRGIEAKAVTGGLNFPGTGNVAAVQFQTSGECQRWISLVVIGLEFSFTHTGPYQEIRTGLEQLAATFRARDAERARQFLIARAPQTPFERAAGFAALSHYQQVAARFHVPTAKPSKPRS